MNTGKAQLKVVSHSFRGISYVTLPLKKHDLPRLERLAELGINPHMVLRAGFHALERTLSSGRSGG